MRPVWSNAVNDALAVLRRMMVGCSIVVFGLAGGCSMRNLPVDAPLTSHQIDENEAPHPSRTVSEFLSQERPGGGL